MLSISTSNHIHRKLQTVEKPQNHQKRDFEQPAMSYVRAYRPQIWSSFVHRHRFIKNTSEYYTRRPLEQIYVHPKIVSETFGHRIFELSLLYFMNSLFSKKHYSNG